MTPTAPPSTPRALALRGIQIDQALARFAGNEQRLRHWLVDFGSYGPTTACQIRTPIAAGAHLQAGRLGAPLSVAAQGVDSRFAAIAAEEANRAAQRGIQSALRNVGETIMALHEAQQRSTAASSKLVAELHETLLNSFYRLGLTDTQEEFLPCLVGNFMTRMVGRLNKRCEAQQALQRLNGKLAELRSL